MTCFFCASSTLLVFSKAVKMIVKGSSRCVFIVFFYLHLLFAFGKVTDPSEVSVLKAIRSGLNDQMEHLLSWKHGDPCKSNWTGVVCDGEEKYLHVTELHMMNLNLSGKLVPELGQLTHLQILNFMWNGLTGTIPIEISNITSLRLLLLNGNKLSGSLPEELGYLPELRRLQIDLNEISGPIPKSLSYLKNIRHLHFNNNSLSGQIPSELRNLSYLHHLLLDNNLLSGYLPPEFIQLPELRILQFDNNNFSGAKIPTAYENFPKLVKLSLRNCSLQGAIPDLTAVTNLTYLDLSWNSLSGSIPSNKYSDKMTTIDLSNNHISGSIPESFSHLPFLQKLSLANNLLSGSFATEILHSRSLNSSGMLLIDLQNNMLSNISSLLNPPENVTLRLRGNPVCNSSAIKNIEQFCRPQVGTGEVPDNATYSPLICPVQSCPIDDYFEYVPDSPLPCFCAAPLRIGYRLKSPSFSYFLPYFTSFISYKTSALSLNLYQLSIDSSSWEKGPRLRMYLKLYPVSGVSIFNTSEVLRIRHRFISWDFDGNDFFGPYELLNFTLLGPYSNLAFDTGGEGIKKGVLIATVIVAVASSVIFSAIVAILIIRRQNRIRQIRSSKRTSSRLSKKIEGIKSFTLKEMALATHDFHFEVGQGGYGTVYKGILTDNTIVAIKRAKEGSVQGEKEFLTEIELLSRLHHRNLVSLLGYCDEGGEQMLVYEFMPNGTLRDRLSAKSKEYLNFGARLHIALGAAKGILYLHTEANPPIFHRDVKASNILLDSNFIAKVADFGLSRLVPYADAQGNEPNHISTVVKGTPGYLDPEYFLTRQLTDKSDVYSFGVVLLEALTGLHPIYRGKNIVREVNLAYQAGELDTMIDNKMGSYHPACVERFASLALWCCQDKPERRPSMLELVRELEDIVHMMADFETDSAESRLKFHSESTIASDDTGRDSHQDSRSGDFISGITLTPR